MQSVMKYTNPMISIEEAQKKMSKESYMILVAVVGSFCAVSQGFIITQSELLLMDPSFLSLMSGYDNTFISHFMAIFYTGEMFGAAISFVFSDMFGRNTTLIYFALLSVLMLLWCAATTSSANLLSARFCLGCCMGVMLATAPVYVAEVATAENRGQSIGFLSLNIVIGSLFAIVSYYFLQPYDFGWRIALFLPVALLLTQALLLKHLPESPRWLLAKKTPGDCLVAMRQLRRRNDVSREFNDIYRGLTSDARLGEGCGDILIHSGSIRMRLCVCLTVQVMQQLAGIQIITVFGFEVLQEMGVHSILLGLFLSALAGLLGSLLLLQNIDRVGRRFLLMAGSIAMGLSWIGAACCALYGGLEHGKAELYFSSYLLRFLFGAFLCLFAFSFSFSLGPIAWILSAEIFPFRARAKASSITVASHFLCAIVGSVFLNRWLQSGYNVASSLFAFGVLCLVCGGFVYMAVPETRGVMSEDMEELFGVDPAAMQCGCCPDVRGAGLLGMRRLVDIQQQRHLQTMKSLPSGAHSSGTVANNHTPSNATGCLTTTDTNVHHHSFIPGPLSGASGSYCSSLGGESQQLFEPSSLHKYSTDLRENKFSYYQESDELLVPSFNLNL